MTKIVITMNEGQSPKFERFEGDLLVGSRKITLYNLLKSFLEDAPMSLIFDVLANSKLEEMEEYLENLKENTVNGDKFLDVLSKVPMELLEHETFSKLGPLVIEKLKHRDLPLEQLTLVLSNWINKIKHVPCQPEFLELYKDLLDYFLCSKESEDIAIQKELLNTFYKHMKNLKEREKINKLVAAHIKHLPSKMLMEAMQERNESSNLKIVYGFTDVPKNASFVATTNKGTTYFYDLPKRKLRVKYQDVPFEDVGHPRLLFAITTGKNGIETVKLCAIKGKKPLTLDTPLYHYPYSNVYSNGKVCWSGYHNLPIDQIPNMFLGTTNNGHLKANTRELFTKYQGKDFPDRMLVSMDLTVEDFC